MNKHEIIRQFLRRLEEGGYILHKDIFTTMDDVAASMGYKLTAHQNGIKGTYIAFEPVE